MLTPSSGGRPGLTREQARHLPGEDDVQFYEQHGWYVTPALLPQQSIDEAVEEAARFYRGERDRSLKIDTDYHDWRPEHGDVLRNNEFASLQSNVFRRFVAQPIIGAVAARLARTSAIRLLDDQLIAKPPRCSSRIGWHADGAYWSTCTSDKLLTAWVPLQDCDESMGGLVVIDGSHQWPGVEHLRNFNDPDFFRLEDRFRAEGHVVRKIPLVLRKGQISFHHRRTVHGSDVNSSGILRLAIAIHLQDADNRYHAFHTPEGKPIHIHDEFLCRRLANGDPDFQDPDVFPLLWPVS